MSAWTSVNERFAPVGSWVKDAVCAQTDPELFHPLSGEDPSDAKAVCNGSEYADPCPVREECLAYSLANPVQGIWAGTSERQRRDIRVRRRKGSAA